MWVKWPGIAKPPKRRNVATRLRGVTVPDKMDAEESAGFRVEFMDWRVGPAVVLHPNGGAFIPLPHVVEGAGPGIEVTKPTVSGQ
jgi:hypothetical protein